MAEKSFSYAALNSDLNEQQTLNLAAATLAKCTKSCFMSMKENELLPTEERCLRNCFVKSHDFNAYFEREFAYGIRNLKM